MIINTEYFKNRVFFIMPPKAVKRKMRNHSNMFKRYVIKIKQISCEKMKLGSVHASENIAR